MSKIKNKTSKIGTQMDAGERRFKSKTIQLLIIDWIFWINFEYMQKHQEYKL